MGGIPKTALNLVAFPSGQMDISVLGAVLAGGLETMQRAGVALIGGHSIQDKEMKYGLSVTGFIHPKRIVQNTGLREGDQLILTKPIGTGIINTAIKGGIAGTETIEMVTQLMTVLNRDAAEAMSRYPVSACTDITGFGLLGHLAEMISDTGVGIQLNSQSIPLIPGTIDFAKQGFIPGGAFNNKSFRSAQVIPEAHIDPMLVDIFFDPQTSGGLLVGIDRESADDLLRDLHQNGANSATIIGEVTATAPGKIEII